MVLPALRCLHRLPLLNIPVFLAGHRHMEGTVGSGVRAGCRPGYQSQSTPSTPSAGACSPHRGHHLEQGGFPTSARSRRTRPAILSPHTAGALPFTHPEREENARERVLCRVSVFIEDDLSADFHRASVANPRHGTPAGFEEPGTVSVWHVQPRLPGGLNLPGKGGGAWL